MIFRLFPGNRQEATIKALYGAIVAQARAPVFYRDYGVPDTVNGRFDMIVLHLALFLDRMEAGSETMRTQGQAAFDLFCREMDGHLREAGISDLKVPKEMQQVGQAFYGRRSVYREALAVPGNRALAEAIARNIYPESPVPADMSGLAHWMMAAEAHLSALAEEEIATGSATLPPVARPPVA